MPQNSIFRLPRSHRFRPKLDLTVMAPNHGGDPLRVHFGANGVPLEIKKLVKTTKYCHAPKFEFSTYGAITQRSNFGRNQWGPIGAKKWVKTAKNCHAPKFEFSTTPRSSISGKIGPYGFGAKSRWGPPRVHLGANGVPLELKNGSKPQKIAMPQNSNFRLPRPAVIDFGQNLTLRLLPNHGGELLWSILGPMGSHWGKKLGQNPRKLPFPKIRIIVYPAVIDFGQNLTLGLWRLITVGNF